MADSTWELKEERLIICEGDHSKFFVESLIKSYELSSFQVGHVYECNGGQKPGRTGFGLAIKGLRAFGTFDKLKSIGLVTDNDDAEALSKIQGDLLEHGCSPTEWPCIAKLEDKPVLIIFIPGCKDYGNLETLCLPVLHSTWAGSEECVKSYLECTGAARWMNHPKELDKARVRSIIAGYFEEDPYKGVGHLFQKGVLSARDAHFDKLADIFKHFDEIVKIGKF